MADATAEAPPEEEAPPAVRYGEEVVGRRLAIQWRGDPGEPWFEGRVRRYIDKGGEQPLHLVSYDDGDKKRHCLGEEERHGQLRWLACVQEL